MPLLLAALFEKGLGILGNAVLAKGKDVIEQKLGISLEESVKTEAGLIQLKTLEVQHEEFLIASAQKKLEADYEAEKTAQIQVTERWKADMLSDSWLSKNIRPAVLLILLTVYFLFALLSAFQVIVTQAYVELLAQMLMLVMGAYFAGRTVEKIVDMNQRGKI